MLIPKITLPKEKDLSSIEDKFNTLPSHLIGHQNWTEYPSFPAVTFKIAHDGENLYLQYKVSETEIRAVEKGNNSNVWEDSCVEFFIAFDDSGFYYNLEQTCIGEALFAYRNGRENAKHANDEVIDAIQRYPSLGKDNFELKEGNFEWTLLSIIPVSSFWETEITSFDGLKATANFYKCGDKLTKPHYLLWAPVSIVQPDFHRTDFFQPIDFGIY